MPDKPTIFTCPECGEQKFVGPTVEVPDEVKCECGATMEKTQG